MLIKFMKLLLFHLKYCVYSRKKYLTDDEVIKTNFYVQKC